MEAHYSDLEDSGIHWKVLQRWKFILASETENIHPHIPKKLL